MIIKGGSRARPGQLAWHLQRLDTNEKVEILELQSPAPTLGEAFLDWQTLSEGTRGTKGLYHANIDPAAGYAMTPDQWRRAVEVLEEFNVALERVFTHFRKRVVDIAQLRNRKSSELPLGATSDRQAPFHASIL